MARGRMLNRRIVKSKKVNSLPDHFTKLFYTWALPFLDRDGRIDGEPDLIKAEIFPRDKTVTEDMIIKALCELDKAGLIIWYEDKEEEKYVQYVQFRENQLRMEYNKEAESAIPPYNKELHKNSRLTLEYIETESTSTRREEKVNGREEKFNEREVEDKEKPQFLPEYRPPVKYQPDMPEKKYDTIWNESIKHWNDLKLPYYKRTLGNENDYGKIINVIAPYSLDEIKGSISAYAENISNLEYSYKTFRTFMTNGGVDQFLDYRNNKTTTQLSQEELDKTEEFAKEVFG